jgi:hypothetical protein
VEQVLANSITGSPVTYAGGGGGADLYTCSNRKVEQVAVEQVVELDIH